MKMEWLWAVFSLHGDQTPFVSDFLGPYPVPLWLLEERRPRQLRESLNGRHEAHGDCARGADKGVAREGAW
jgi:hypothetical protein